MSPVLFGNTHMITTGLVKPPFPQLLAKGNPRRLSQAKHLLRFPATMTYIVLSNNSRHQRPPVRTLRRGFPLMSRDALCIIFAPYRLQRTGASSWTSWPIALQCLIQSVSNFQGLLLWSWAIQRYQDLQILWKQTFAL